MNLCLSCRSAALPVTCHNQNVRSRNSPFSLHLLFLFGVCMRGLANCHICQAVRESFTWLFIVFSRAENCWGMMEGRYCSLGENLSVGLLNFGAACSDRLVCWPDMLALEREAFSWESEQKKKKKKRNNFRSLMVMQERSFAFCNRSTK